MDTFLMVICEYFEHDASRYKLALMQHTLAESLRRQTCKDFKLVIAISPMDPYFSRRLEIFDSIGVEWYLNDEIELPDYKRYIITPDDVFLHPSLVEWVNCAPETDDISYDMRNGFICNNKIIRYCKSKKPIVSVEQVAGGRTFELHMDYCWIAPDHQMSHFRGVSGAPTPHRWDGWNESLIHRISKTKIVTSTALGCNLHPTKSASVIRADREYTNRGRVYRGKATKRVNYGY